MLTYSLTGYRNRLRTTRNRVLLVEGRDDKRAFVSLFREVAGFDINAADVIIDTAEIVELPGLNSREKVEHVCNTVRTSPHGVRFVGFSDREFRGFDLNGRPIDTIGDHKVDAPLIWSRGHSLENYFFDVGVLAEAFRSATVSVHVEEAIQAFANRFDQVVRSAAAISLAGLGIGNLELVRSSLQWTVMDAAGPDMISVAEWRSVLREKVRAAPEQIDLLIESYGAWLERTRDVPASALRWLIHGHIGLTHIWSAYIAVLFAAGGKSITEIRSLLGIGEPTRCTSCAETWARRIIAHGHDYPAEVFRLLTVASKPPPGSPAHAATGASCAANDIEHSSTPDSSTEA